VAADARAPWRVRACGARRTPNEFMINKDHFLRLIAMVSVSKDLCNRCRGVMVTDNESGEMFCSACGYVVSRKAAGVGP